MSNHLVITRVLMLEPLPPDLGILDYDFALMGNAPES
jgi:hypothetical protein